LVTAAMELRHTCPNASLVFFSLEHSSLASNFLMHVCQDYVMQGYLPL